VIVRFGNLPLEFDILFYRGVSRRYIELARITHLDVSAIATDFLTRCMRTHAGSDGMIYL
jgi:hypothetical protein